MPGRVSRVIARALFAIVVLGLTLATPAPAEDAGESGRDRPTSTAGDRAASRTAWRGLGRDAAWRALEDHFPDFARRPVWEPLGGIPRERVRYLSDHVARIDYGPGERKQLAQSFGVPLRAPDANGGRTPVDLGLRGGRSGFESVNPVVDVRYPSRLGAGIEFVESGVSIAPAGADAGDPLRAGDKLFWANSRQDSDVLVEPSVRGAEISVQVRSADAPSEYALGFDLPHGATLQLDRDARTGVRSAGVLSDGRRLLHVSPAVAVDSEGRDVPVEYELSGDDLVMRVDHPRGDFMYPILVDPIVEDQSTWYTNGQFDNRGWGFVNLVRSGPSGDSWGSFGTGLYIRVPPGTDTHTTEAAWRFTRYGTTSFVSRADFLRNLLWYQNGSSGTIIREGLWSAPAGKWNNYATIWQNYPNTVDNIVRPEFGTTDPDWRTVTSADFRTIIPYDPSTWNEAYLGGTVIYLEDHDSPTITQPVANADLSQWHAGGESIRMSATAADTGLGVKWFDVYGPGGIHESRDHGCTGDRNGRCPDTWTTPDGYFTVNTSTAPEGTTSWGMHATDVLGRQSSQKAWTAKIDRTPPEMAVTGGLHEYDPNSRDLHIEATEPTDRAGVRDIKLLIDRDHDGTYLDEPGSSERVAYQDQTCVPGDARCMELSYVLPPTFPEGTYRAKAVVTDRAGNLVEDEWDFQVANLWPTMRSKLGLEDYFDYDSTDTGAGTGLHVNAQTGNVVWHSVPVVNPGRGLSTVVNLTYNSHDRGGLLGSQLGNVPLVGVADQDLARELPGLSYGEVGAGFSLGISGPTRVNEPLGGVQLAEAGLSDTITLTDADGTVHAFQRDAGKWVAPPGIDLHLRRFSNQASDPQRREHWAMTRPDGVTHFFDQYGYLQATKDRNGNTLNYLYQLFETISGNENDPRCATIPVATLTHVAGAEDLFCVPRLKAVVDPAGPQEAPNETLSPGAVPQSRKLTIDYKEGGLLATGGLPIQPAGFAGLVGGRAGRIESITDHAARTTEFEYEDGLLSKLTEAANHAERRVTRFAYEEKDDGLLPEDPGDDAIGQDRQLAAVIEIRDDPGTPAEDEMEYARTTLLHEDHDAGLLAAVPGIFKEPRRVKAITNRRGFAKSYLFTSAGANTTMSVEAAVDAATPPATVETEHETDGPGRPVRITNAVGSDAANTTRLDWSADNRVTQLIEAADTADAATTDMTYNHNGLLTTRTTYPDETARPTTLVYDSGKGNHVAAGAADEGGTFVSDLQQMQNPKPNTGWTFEFDGRGNVTARIDAKGNRAETSYDDHGQIKSETDEVGNKVTYKMEADGTEAPYHPTGQPRVVIDPRGNQSGGNPAEHLWRYEYDEVGNLDTVTTRAGR